MVRRALLGRAFARSRAEYIYELPTRNRSLSAVRKFDGVHASRGKDGRRDTSEARGRRGELPGPSALWTAGYPSQTSCSYICSPPEGQVAKQNHLASAVVIVKTQNAPQVKNHEHKIQAHMEPMAHRKQCAAVYAKLRRSLQEKRPNGSSIVL